MVANRDLVARVRPDIIQAIDRDFIEPLQNFLEKAQARGDIGATDSWAAARALTTLLFAEAHRHLENSEPAKAPDLMAGAHFLTTMFFKGITGIVSRRSLQYRTCCALICLRLHSVCLLLQKSERGQCKVRCKTFLAELQLKTKDLTVFCSIFFYILRSLKV